MKTLPTTLPGVLLIDLDVHEDARGCFMETFRQDRYAAAGIGDGAPFVQDNFSSSSRGTLRGLHYQLERPQGKLVWVTRGEVFDVVVDVRRGSPTFGRWFGASLSAASHRQLWIPPGFAHGFTAISEHADLAYKVTAYYAPDDDHALRWNDPELAISWPLQGEPSLSRRDAAAPGLREAALPTWAP
jgi:dTDP-4-dehydrorhamnose 3,5-epimerase